jgi:hypothetical protein
MRIMITAGALLALSAAPAAARCAQDQLTGDWTLMGSNNGAWTRCELAIDGDGAFEGRCRGTGRPRRGGTPVEGVLELNARCAFTGSLESGGTSQAIQGVLDEAGTSGAGITQFGTRRQNFGLLFSLIKRP